METSTTMSDKSFPKVSIITVNYNETEATIELLESIKANSYQNVEVIVVDNASKINPSETFQKGLFNS